MNNCLILEAYNMTISVDTNNKTLLSCNTQDEEIDESSQGVLTSVNTELGVMIENHFKITLSDYGVGIYDEVVKDIK